MSEQIQNQPTDQILKEIELLQNIQKSCPPTDPEWRKASEKLEPRFAEMARRTA